MLILLTAGEVSCMGFSRLAALVSSCAQSRLRRTLTTRPRRESSRNYNRTTTNIARGDRARQGDQSHVKIISIHHPLRSQRHEREFYRFRSPRGADFPTTPLEDTSTSRFATRLRLARGLLQGRPVANIGISQRERERRFQRRMSTGHRRIGLGAVLRRRNLVG